MAAREAVDDVRPIEQLRSHWDSIAGCTKDQYRRDAETCARSASQAKLQAIVCRAAVSRVKDATIVLGRLAGGRHLQRLEAAATVFDRVAERDDAFAEQLREADEIRTRGVHARGANADSDRGLN